MTQINDKYWIIKFPAHVDKQNSGKMEYDYSLCARKCGIEMTETRLFPSQTSSGYFGTKRFDRVVEEGCVLMCMLHNRDDHAKNFSFIYDEERKKWHMSPAYDLTYSNTYYGEHTTTVDGNWAGIRA